MRGTPYFLIFVCVAGMGWLFSRDFSAPRQVNLPTSKVLTAPVPGLLGPLNGFAANMALSPDGKYAAVLNDGYGNQASGGKQSIAVVDLATNKITDFPDDRLGNNAHQTYFLGLAFSSDGKHLYASMSSISDPVGEKSGDTGNGTAVYAFDAGKLSPERFIKIAPQTLARGKEVAIGVRKTPPGTAVPYPAGLAVVPAKDGDKLLVANNLSDSVVLLDLATGNVLKQFDLSMYAKVPFSFPYTVVVARDGKRAWCSLWNLSRIAELDLERGTVVRWVPLLLPSSPTAPGSHPTAMLLGPDGSMLYVALSNADRVMMVPTTGEGPVRALNTAPRSQQFGGSCPNALALSGDGKWLFAADACINAVAVFDVAKATEGARSAKAFPAEGFVPTDWYPSALAFVGDDLLVATSKGIGTGPNNMRDTLLRRGRPREHPYIATLLTGSVSRLRVSEVIGKLAEFTERVERDNRFGQGAGEIRFAAGRNPIKHVIYVLKENRTYDQVLGDLGVGNGDPSLTMYGKETTPNLHKIALQFGVLDNFYDSGEVSGDGHEWSTAAITSDYNEKTWQITYRGREHTYDYQGLVAEEQPLENGGPDVDAPGTGYIWDNVASHGLTYRDYGEFIQTIWCKPDEGDDMAPNERSEARITPECPRLVVNKGEALPGNVGAPHGSASPWPWPVPMIKRTKATKAVLRDHFGPMFPDFNTDYPDQLRADEFLNEFAGFVKSRAEGKGTELPAFVLLYLPDDHTHGTTPGKPRPAASVADNDLAVGRVIEAVSNSPYWDDTAIFIVEDDAQDGTDHVDAHRSTAYVISKYSPGSVDHPFVDHSFYTTVNMIHTMEVLLGLPPMNQNDAYAPVMARLFTGTGGQLPYKTDWRNRDNGLIYQTNPPGAPGAKQSAKMDFTRPDAVNTPLLNAILWREQMGNRPMPEARHNVFPVKMRSDND